MKMGDICAKSTISWLLCQHLISNWIIISSNSISISIIISISSAGPDGCAV